MNLEPIPGMDHVATIVAAYVSNPNHIIPHERLGAFVISVHEAVTGLAPGAVAAQALKPAVPIKKSVTDEYIVCLEDGQKLKMLKRYLRSNFGLTPEQYRQRWGLPVDYPMTSPNYSAQRSEFARKIGLGKSKVPHKKGRR